MKRFTSLFGLFGLFALVAVVTVSTLSFLQTDNAALVASLEQKYTNSASKFIELDGNRVHYRDEGQGPVLVLIHGTASSLHTWDSWTEQLKDRYRVIRMDLPGFGLTGPDHSDRYEVKDDARFIELFLTALNIPNAHFAGSSLGGRIAWQMALSHPERVRSLTLLNALGYPQERWPPAIEMAQWPIIDSLMSVVSPRFMYEIGLKEVYFSPDLVTQEVVDRYYELSRYPGNLPAFTKRVKARLDKDAQQIPNIKQPTLILWGKEDLYFPAENAQRFKEDIRNAELEVYADVGHLPMEENANESLRDMMRFLAKQESSNQSNTTHDLAQADLQ